MKPTHGFFLPRLLPIRDPYGNVMIIVDRSSGGGEAIETGKAPGALCSGVEEKIEVKREQLIHVYEQIGRTADDLPYTPDFEKLHAACALFAADGNPAFLLARIDGLVRAKGVFEFILDPERLGGARDKPGVAPLVPAPSGMCRSRGR